MKISFVVIAGRSKIAYNGLQLQEVGDFEALNCLPPQNLIRSTKLHLITEPPISCRCCYLPFYSVHELQMLKVLSMNY